jgi:hypothetical protein
MERKFDCSCNKKKFRKKIIVSKLFSGGDTRPRGEAYIPTEETEDELFHHGVASGKKFIFFYFLAF